MADQPRMSVWLRRAAAWAFGWVFAGALYLLLIDTPSLPELIVGAAAATIAATGFELAREQQVVGASFRFGWLARVYRPIVKVPSDIAFVSTVAIRQLFRPEPSRGQFRTVAFSCGDQQELETGRRALAESLGSFAPNTIIIGVDGERELILGHQLWVTGARTAIDVLELG
jgi:hypothetical protein